MKLQVFERSVEKKREAKRIRRSGNIPAVVYTKGEASQHISLNGAEFSALLRKVIPGHLPTTVFDLVDSKGKTRRALVKDIQYKPTTYDVHHLDFEELIPKEPVNVKVPIVCIGTMDCVGVKLGGVVRQVIRHTRVSCPSELIPTHFEIDVKELNLAQYRRLSDLSIPKEMRPLDNLNEVAVVIVKR